MTHESLRLRAAISEDGGAILDAEHGTITTLNFTGARVWQATERGESPEEIAATLARETGESIETVTKDVQKFLETLHTKNLLSSQ